jgi:hypothetical protein
VEFLTKILRAVLRNSGSALTAALRFMQLSLNWRPSSRTAKNESAASHTLFYITTALMVSVGFGVIGTFVSQLITKAASGQVLLIPQQCGYFELRNYTNPDNAKIYLSADADAQMYAGRCYEMKSKLACKSNMKKLIQSAATDESCPFGKPDICLGSSKPAYRMESELMDSNHELGLNAESSQRLQIRKVATCVPLNLANYVTHEEKNISVGERGFNNVNIAFFQLGPRCKTQAAINVTDTTSAKNEPPNDINILNPIVPKPMTMMDVPINTTYQYVKAARLSSLGYDLRYLSPASCDD